MIEDAEELELVEDDEEQPTQLYEHYRFEVDRGQVPVRIDKFMFEKLQHSSRNRIQKAAEAGFVHVNDRPVKSNYKVRPGDVVTLMMDRPHYDTTIEPEDIPLDVVYEWYMRTTSSWSSINPLGWWCIQVWEISMVRW